MAIAPLPERPLGGDHPRRAELAESRAGLRLVEAGTALGRRVGAPGLDLVVRRRRRRALLGLGVAATAVALALPVSVLGGRPAAAVGAASTAPGAGAVYVVQPGDTLWSIAARMDRTGDPRPLAEAIARETGSTVVVPGERIRVP